MEWIRGPRSGGFEVGRRQSVGRGPGLRAAASGHPEVAKPRRLSTQVRGAARPLSAKGRPYRDLRKDTLLEPYVHSVYDHLYASGVIEADCLAHAGRYSFTALGGAVIIEPSHHGRRITRETTPFDPGRTLF